MKKDKAVSWLIRIFSLAILFGTIVWTTTRTGVISLVGIENIYWERARFLLGEGGASVYNGSSLCSLGYSLILMPICALIKSPYAAYKAAVLLNGIFLCAGYLTAVGAAKKLFPKESENFLCGACFFAVFTPALMISKTYTGPEMAVLLLTWVSLYLLVSIWEKYDSRKIAALAACMILIGFLQITALGLILAVVILLWLYVNEKKLEEDTLLFFVLALLLGLAAGNIAERAFLYAFTKEMDLTTVRSSLEVLMDGISTFASQGWLTGFASMLAGKLYSVLIASFLLVCPAFWYLGRVLIRRDRKAYQETLPVLGVIGIFLVQFIWMCLYDNSLGLKDGLISLSGLEMLLPPVLLIGIVQIRHSNVWDRQMPVYLLLLCVCTFATAGTIRAGTLKSGGLYQNSGFLKLFQNMGDSIGSTAVYMAACVVMLAALVLAALLLGPEKKYDRLMKTAGVSAALILFAVISVQAVQQSTDTWTKTKMNTIAPVASLINETGTQSACVYLDTGQSKSNLAVLQSLTPQKQILVSDKTETDLLTQENQVILTATNQSQIEDLYQSELSEYQILYMTNAFSLWAPRGSALLTEIEEDVEQRMESLPFSRMEEIEEEEEDEETEEEDFAAEEAESEEISEFTEQSLSLKYGGNLKLAAGTYRIEVHLHKKKTADGTGTLTVTSGSETLAERTFDEMIFDDNGDGIVSVELTSRRPVWNAAVTVQGTLLDDVSVKRVSCQKMSETYLAALDDREQAESIANAIYALDFTVETTGTVAYMDPLIPEPEEVSLQVFEEQMPEYSLTAVTEAELSDLNTDYLISKTDGHAYLELMDRYSVISLDSSYTVLARNDSIQYQTYLEHGGQMLSDGTNIDITAFTGGKKITSPISLSGGDYLYHVSLTFDSKNLVGEDDEIAGIVYIVNKDNILAEEEITYADLRNCKSDQLDVEVPLYLPSQKSNLRCRLKVSSTAFTAAAPVSIELVAGKYQYGIEEEEIGELLDLINTLPAGTKVSVLQTEKIIQNQTTGYEWLQEQLPACQVQEINETEALDMTEDGVLLTYGLRKPTLQVISKYSILGHAGRYTLWARTNGENLQQLVSAGADVLTNGKKISPASLAAMNGDSDKGGKENIIDYLPALNYTIYLKLTVQDLDEDDTIELTLYRKKSREEIINEYEELLDSGYEEEEAISLIDPQASCGSKTIEASAFEESDNMLVSLKKKGGSATNKLWCDAYTWKKGEIETEIVWVEIQ